MREGLDVRLAAAGLLVALLGCLLAGYQLTRADTPLLIQDSSAPWIALDAPINGNLRQYGQVAAPRTRFERDFELDSLPDSAELRIRAFGQVRVELNGAALLGGATSPAASGGVGEIAGSRVFQRVDVTPYLQPGSNALRAEVRNLHGPALLSLAVDQIGPGATRVPLLATGPTWEVSLDDSPSSPARFASDALPLPDAHLGESPLPMLLRHAELLALLAVMGAAVFFLFSHKRSIFGRETEWPRYALYLVSAAWITLFALKLSEIKPGFGFDVSGHREYVDFLKAHKRLPLANDGWSTYHPPLFYLLSLVSSTLLQWLGISRVLAEKVLPFAAAFGNAWLALRLTRQLLPGARPAWICALFFAGFLPLNFVLAAYFGNEGLHALLTAAGLVVAVELLLAPQLEAKKLALCSALFGFALLTKFTAALIALPALLALAIKLVTFDSGRSSEGHPRRLRLVALLLPVLLLSGSFYLRNTLVFGQPLVGNWSLDTPGLVWWSPPGFHTPGYYTRFGALFVQPYLSGFVSFWDALYSTFWGDGMLGGQISLGTRHGRWNYELMSATFLLALPACALLLCGFAQALRGALRDPRRERRAALALLVVSTALLFFAIFVATLGLPYFGQARALYASAAVPTLAFFFASALRTLDAQLAARRLNALRTLLYAYLGVLLGFCYLSFAG